MSNNSTNTGTLVEQSSSSGASVVATQSTTPPSSTQAAPTSTANTTPTSAPTTSVPTTAPTTTAVPTTTQAPSPTTTSPTTTSTAAPPTTSTTPPTTSNPPTTTNVPTTTSEDPTTSQLSPTVIVSTITQSPTNGGTTSIVILTSTQTPTQQTGTKSSSSSTSGAPTAGIQPGSSNANTGGLTGGGKIAVAVVVPIAAVALIVLALLFFWRKRKQRKDAEELRRKEVEEYGYNPNSGPTLPAVGVLGSAGHDGGGYEMTEDASGYRGWGTTAVGSSTGRKASTTVSGGQSGGIGMAYSEGTSPTQGPHSDTRSDNPLMDRPLSGDLDAIGAMGPATSGNRGEGVNRGPSNASSSYSAANRSDGSGELSAREYQNQSYYNQYDPGNPYNSDPPHGSPPNRAAEMSGQPIIRDVQARRNTRIENPSHFPQQSAGISQNF